jgi:hypothetical protein
VIITYFRSSSFGDYSRCPMSYYLNYQLGIPCPSNKKASIGSAVHKAMELLARKKLALQNNDLGIYEDELGRKFSLDEITEDSVPLLGFEWIQEKEKHLEWTIKDQKEIIRLSRDILALNGGDYNPLQRDIVQCEQYFDFTIDEPWAKFRFELDGKPIEGQLALKGTVDLICRLGPNLLECQDYKTGRRIDWGTGKEKDWKKLRNDPQLRIYHYALSKLYPNQQIIMTIIYVADGGVFSLPYGPEDLKLTEEMLRTRFHQIRECERPHLNIGWQCKAFCYFGKNEYKNTGKTICQHFADEVLQIGLKKTTEKYADRQKLIGKVYSGGGRT